MRVIDGLVSRLAGELLLFFWQHRWWWLTTMNLALLVEA